MLNKRDYSDLETGAGDWRALTGSNPTASSAEGFPPPPSGPLPSLFPAPLLLHGTQAGWEEAEGTLRGHEGIPPTPHGAVPLPSTPLSLLPWKRFLSLPGPEDWQGTEDSVLFVLSPQTHTSLVLFFGLQAPELFCFVFLLFFALPPCTQSKALWKRTCLPPLAPQVFWSVSETRQQEGSRKALGAFCWMGTFGLLCRQQALMFSLVTRPAP